MSLKNAALAVSDPALMLERLGGLTILERHLFLLKRAGIERVWVGMAEPAASLRLPDGLALVWGSVGAEIPHLAVSADHLTRLSVLRDAVKNPADAGEDRPLPEDARVALSRPLAGGPADAWLMREAVKGTDGFMARHFDRHISLAVTRRLLDTGVTPNQMTLASTAVGLCGAGLLAAGTYGGSLAGSLLIWLHSTLDGCDGELARLRFQESPLGGVLDFWGDNLVHAALFTCLGLGLSRAQSSRLPALLGLLAAAGASASAALAYLHNRRKAVERAAAGPFFKGVGEAAPGAAEAEKRLAAAQDALAQRDFVYLLVVLAAVDRLPWFLWASALGSPLFLAVLLWLRRGSSRPRPA